MVQNSVLPALAAATSLQRIKILIQQNRLIRRRWSSLDAFLELLNGLLQTCHNGLTLLGETDTRQTLCFRVRFGSLNDTQFLASASSNAADLSRWFIWIAFIASRTERQFHPVISDIIS